MSSKEEQIASLQSELANFAQKGFACGKLEGFNGNVFAGGCGGHVDFADSYRCADCTASFHRDCIRKHFEADSDTYEAEVVKWRERAEKAESELERARQELAQRGKE